MVTSAAGFIGSHLGERAVAEGRAVLGLDAFTELAEGLREEVTWVERAGRAGGFPDD